MADLDPGTRGEWLRSRNKPKTTAAIMYSAYVSGKEPGTVLPATRHLEKVLSESPTAIGHAKRLLGEHGALRKEHGRWVVA